MKNQSRGFTLIELTVVMVIASLMLIVVYKLWIIPAIEKQVAREAGREFAMYSFAVQRRLTQEGVDVLGGAPSLSVTGVDWLQKDCLTGLNLAPNTYLDCDFSALNPYGEEYSVLVTEPVAGRVRAEVSIPGPKLLVTGPSSTLADVDPNLTNVFRNTAASRQPGMSPVSTMFYSITTKDGDGDGVEDTIVSVQSTEIALDIWVRRDGADEMAADLPMGGHSIVDAKSGEFSDFIKVSGGGWGTSAGLGASWSTSTNALYANDADVRIVGGNEFVVEANNLLRLQATDSAVLISNNTLNLVTSDGGSGSTAITSSNDRIQAGSMDNGVSTSITIDADPGLSASIDIQTANPAATPTGVLDFIQIGGGANPKRGTLVSTNDTSIGYVANRGIVEILDFDNGAGMQDGILAFADNPGGDGVEVSGQGFDLRVTGTGNNEATLVADNVYDPTVNRYLDQAVFDKTVVLYNGTPIKIPKPTCKANRIPQIFLTAQGYYHISGRPIRAAEAHPVDMGKYWLVEGLVWIDSDLTKIRLKENVMKIIVDRKCT